MKKYTRPMVEIVELSVKESLSALNLPTGFNKATTNFGSKTSYKNVTIYTKASTQTPA